MGKYYDAAVIGAGLLGCFTARNLKRYNISVVIIEKNSDVCTGISRANTAVVYPGYDNRPGSLKAEMTVRACRGFDSLCRELDVPFSRCGSLMTARGPEGDEILRKKLRHGVENGVEGLEIVNGTVAKEIETALGDGITSALYCRSTGTVNPWEMCVAAYESAVLNGAEALFNTEVLSVDGQTVKTDKGEIRAGFVIDCSGLNAGRLTDSRYRVCPDCGDYLVIDRLSKGKPSHIVFEQSEIKCRGITAVPTVEGSLLLGPTHRDGAPDCSTECQGLEEVRASAGAVLPGLEMNIIKNFAAVRPNVETDAGDDVHDFVIDEKDNTLCFIGIKTPGMTCAEELGKYAAGKCASYLQAGYNPDFKPERKGIRRVRDMSFDERAAAVKADGDNGVIVCRCEEITLAEIKEAVRRGAVTPDGIKHRLGTGMGTCQGLRCLSEIEKILEAKQC